MVGNRAIYHDGWIAATTPPAAPWLLATGKLPDLETGYKWELYDIAKDYSESNDLAAKMPEKLKEMQALLDTEAEKHDVLPARQFRLCAVTAARPSASAGRTGFHLVRRKHRHSRRQCAEHPGPRLHDHRRRDRSPRGGAEGMIVTLGGRFGGYGLYLLHGKPVFDYNFLDLRTPDGRAASPVRTCSRGRSTAGKHAVVFDFKYDGPGLAKAGRACSRSTATNCRRKHRAYYSVADVDRRNVRRRRGHTHAGRRQLRCAVSSFTGAIDTLTFDLRP